MLLMNEGKLYEIPAHNPRGTSFKWYEWSNPRQIGWKPGWPPAGHDTDVYVDRAIAAWLNVGRYWFPEQRLT